MSSQKDNTQNSTYLKIVRNSRILKLTAPQKKNREAQSNTPFVPRAKYKGRQQTDSFFERQRSGH